MYKGIGASAGIGIGKIVKIMEEELNYAKQSIEDTEAEKKRLSDAIEVFIEKTQKMVESMKVTAGEQEAEILEGHIMMIQDPAISEQIEAKIDGEKINAEAAVEEACDFFAQIFAMADDELTQQRASDSKISISALSSVSCTIAFFVFAVFPKVIPRLFVFPSLFIVLTFATFVPSNIFSTASLI